MTAITAEHVVHGTRKGYLWERSRGLPTCDACRTANRRDAQRHWQAKKTSGAETEPGERIDCRSVMPPTATLTTDEAPVAECAQHSRPDVWFSDDQLFVNSMSDLFHDDIPDEYIGSVFEVMAKAQQHTFQVLTKRPGRMRSLLKRWATQGEAWAGPGTAVFRRADKMWVGPIRWPLPNVWLGVSAEDQRWANVRIPVLLDTPAAVRFVSAEPMLGPIDFEVLTGISSLSPDWVGGPSGGSGAPHPLLDWVIVGGESGRGARPMDLAWARSIRDQCKSAGVAFLYKQQGSGDGGPKSRRELDGRTWDEFPAVAA